MSRASLLEYYDAQQPVTGVFGPRCGDHVGLDDAAAFFQTLGPDTDEAFVPPSLIPDTHVDFHESLYAWLDVGVPGQAPVRRLDTDQPDTHFASCGGHEEYARWLDLECYLPDAQAHEQDLDRSIELRQLNPLLAPLPSHSVRVRRFEEFCTPVQKNSIVPPDSVLDLIRFTDFACYEIENGPRLDLPLKLSHINPVLEPLDPPFSLTETIAGAAKQLCTPVAKNLPSNSIPQRTVEFLRHLDLQCFEISAPPIENLQPALRLGQLNPIMSQLPDELYSNFQPRQVCVPVHKQGNPAVPSEILDLIKHVSIEKYQITPTGTPSTVNITLKQINPLFASVPDVAVQTLTPRHVGLPVHAEFEPLPVPMVRGVAARVGLAALLIAFGAIALTRGRAAKRL
jgi:hypothetical protein